MSLQETSEMTLEDREALRKAVRSFEHPSLAARLTNLVGKPVELIGYALPSFASTEGLNECPGPCRRSQPNGL